VLFFEKCFSFKYFGLCSNIALKLVIKNFCESCWIRIPITISMWMKKIKVLEHLKEDYWKRF